MTENIKETPPDRIDESTIFRSKNSLLVSTVSGGVLGLSFGIVTERILNAFEETQDYRLVGAVAAGAVITAITTRRMHRGPSL